MKYLIMILIAVTIVSCNEDESTPEIVNDGSAGGQIVKDKEIEAPSERNQKISYQMGKDFFIQSEQNEFNLNLDYFVKGYLDTKLKRKSLTDDNEMDTLMQSFMNQMQVRQGKAQAKSNRILNEKSQNAKESTPRLLAKVAEDPEFTKHKSGIFYRVIKKSDETDEPLITDKATVMIHMKTTLSTGDMIDDSWNPQYGGGQPRSVPVQQLFPGFIEGLKLMRVGDRFEFVIPPDMAFGENGDGRLIPGHTAIILEVEVFDVIQ